MNWQNLRTNLHHSLLLRLGGMVIAITLLALVGMSTSWIVAETTQGNGEAINVAGSLRMQTWRMLSLHQSIEQAEFLGKSTTTQQHLLQRAMEQFENSLVSSSIQSVMPDDENTLLTRTLHQIENDWQKQLKPHLIQSPRSFLTQQLQVEAPIFVGQIDDLVKQIEEATEAKIFVLRVILAVAIAGTLLMVILTVYLINNLFVQPLRSLLELTDQLSQGNLIARSCLTGEDEIGQLGAAFDRMAEELSKLYQSLEARVTQKTAELTRSNQSLDLLYRSITRLHGHTPTQETFQTLLKDVESALGLGAGSLCLMGEYDTRGHVVANTNNHNLVPICEQFEDCGQCKLAMLEQSTLAPSSTPDTKQILRLSLRNAEKHYGVLAVNVPHGQEAESWQIQLLQALSQHIGVTIASEQRIEQSRRMALLEERAVIARELHDSLAQSLAYMKIQVSRLSEAVKAHEEAEVSLALQELREGLNSSYHQLRELLSTFRLRMEDADLGRALTQTVKEFSERGQLPITLNFNLDHHLLTPK